MASWLLRESGAQHPGSAKRFECGVYGALTINFDLGCDGADARHLMEALEEQFGINFIDYDAYRYFQPEGFDVHLKRRAKGRGEKVPLTIGMLYRAIKVQRWDTQEQESK